MKCIKCGREHQDYHFRVLQVQTLHVRDFGRNSRIQALGDFEEYDVCATCAEEKYNATMDITKTMGKTMIIWSLIMVLGAILAIAFWRGEGVLRLAGLGGLVGGGLYLFGAMQAANRRKGKLILMEKEDALYQCAWECMIEGAPKKNDINDITYIPVDEKTLERKNGDLMILYDLVPEIAVEAHKRLHAQDLPDEEDFLDEEEDMEDEE